MYAIKKSLYLSASAIILCGGNNNVLAYDLSLENHTQHISLSESAPSYQIARMQFLPDVADDLGMSGRHFKSGYYSGDSSCSDYDLTACPTGWKCLECTKGLQTKYKTNGCKDGYVLNEEGTECEKTCSLTDCVDKVTSKPENSSYTTESCTDCSGSKTIKTGWTCNQGFYPQNDKCVEDCTLPDCVDKVTSKPENSTYTTETCTDCSGTKEIKTGWDCDNGYHKKDTQCERDCAVNNCSGFDLIKCPDHGICSDCTKRAQNCSTDGVRYKLDRCEDGYEPSGNTCVEKKVSPTIPEGYSTTPCSSSHEVETDKIQDETGRWLYQCKDCMAYAKHLGKAVVYEDAEFHEDLLYKALISGAEEIYVSGLVWISNEAAKACANANRTCAQTITFKNLKDFHNICAYEQDGELDGSGQEFQINWMNLNFEIPVYLEKLKTNNGHLGLQFGGPHGIESTIEEIYTNNTLHIVVNSGELNIGSIAANGNVYFDCGANAFINSYMATSWCCNNKDQFYCQQSCFRNGTGCF